MAQRRSRFGRSHRQYSMARRARRIRWAPISELEGVDKDFARLLRRASPWDRRNMEGWRGFQRGVAWVMLYGGVPAKQTIHAHGMIDEWPYHISKCTVISMDPTLTLHHRRSRSAHGQEYWWLADKKGNHKWGKRGPKGKVQTAYRFLGQRAKGRRRKKAA